MNTVQFFDSIMDYIPELFPHDLAAITLSDCEHFVNVWGREDSQLGQSLKTVLYPGKELTENVMLGQVVKENKKITKFYTREESVSGVAYLAVGVPIYEGETLIGGICIVRENTVLETQNRCKSLLEVEQILTQSMNNVELRLQSLMDRYEEMRGIASYFQDISNTITLMSLTAKLSANQIDTHSSELVTLSKEAERVATDAKQLAEKVVQLLNHYDEQGSDLFVSVKHIETAVSRMGQAIDEIMEFLTLQANQVLHSDIS